MQLVWIKIYTNATCVVEDLLTDSDLTCKPYSAHHTCAHWVRDEWLSPGTLGYPLFT